MQPVTIDSNQFFSTLWLIQIVLLTISGILILISLKFNLWLLILLIGPLALLFINQSKISQQRFYRFKMNGSGELSLVKDIQLTQQSLGRLKVETYWQMPQLLFLKMKHNKQTIYAAVFRSVLGPRNFSHLLVGIMQSGKHDEN